MPEIPKFIARLGIPRKLVDDVEEAKELGKQIMEEYNIPAALIVDVRPSEVSVGPIVIMEVTKDHFERLVWAPPLRPRNIFCYGLSGTARVHGETPYWFNLGDVRVMTEAKMLDEGFFKDVVFPSYEALYESFRAEGYMHGQSFADWQKDFDLRHYSEIDMIDVTKIPLIWPQVQSS